VLLREGATPVPVADGLDDMIRRMQQIQGGWAGPDSWSLAQKSYLQLVETLEQALRFWAGSLTVTARMEALRRTEYECLLLIEECLTPAAHNARFCAADWPGPRSDAR